MMFETVQNYHEKAVFQEVSDRAIDHPALADSPELLADVACIALNRIPTRYICSKVDMTFYMDDKERLQNDAAVTAAVEAAFRFVEARVASATRG
jgi:hypothetical protein